jgi:hypothetical protein
MDEKYIIHPRKDEIVAIEKRGTNVQVADENGYYVKKRNANYSAGFYGLGPTYKTMLIKGDLDKLSKTFFDFDDLDTPLERDAKDTKRRKPNTYAKEVKQAKQIEKIVETAKVAPITVNTIGFLAKWYAKQDNELPLETFLQTPSGRYVKSFHQFIKDTLL